MNTRSYKEQKTKKIYKEWEKQRLKHQETQEKNRKYDELCEFLQKVAPWILKQFEESESSQSVPLSTIKDSPPPKTIKLLTPVLNIPLLNSNDPLPTLNLLDPTSDLPTLDPLLNQNLPPSTLHLQPPVSENPSSYKDLPLLTPDVLNTVPELNMELFLNELFL